MKSLAGEDYKRRLGVNGKGQLNRDRMMLIVRVKSCLENKRSC